MLSACQTVPKTAPNTTPIPQLPTDTTPLQFAITGKIGVSTQTADGRNAGSAFYTWGQDGERFAIDLTGALGIGATSIRFDGQTATLTSDKTGTITADSPDALLEKATGWQAPIADLPFWIMGKNAPNDYDSHYQDGRLLQTSNGAWQASFDYNNTPLPSRLIINHQDGHRVIVTITRVA